MLAVEKMHQQLNGKLPAMRSQTPRFQSLIRITYLSAIAIATLGWLWLLVWCAIELVA
jgi:hypothetical protein